MNWNLDRIWLAFGEQGTKAPRHKGFVEVGSLQRNVLTFFFVPYFLRALLANGKPKFNPSGSRLGPDNNPHRRVSLTLKRVGEGSDCGFDAVSVVNLYNPVHRVEEILPASRNRLAKAFGA